MVQVSVVTQSLCNGRIAPSLRRLTTRASPAWQLCERRQYQRYKYCWIVLLGIQVIPCGRPDSTLSLLRNGDASDDRMRSLSAGREEWRTGVAGDEGTDMVLCGVCGSARVGV